MKLPKDAKPIHQFDATPAEVAAAWDSDHPIVALIGNRGDSTWSRWSIVAPADGKRITLDSPDALEQFGALLSSASSHSLLPNWIGYLGYELGYAIEPACGTIPNQSWPLIDVVWCDRGLIHDAETNKWWSVGGCVPPEIQGYQEPCGLNVELEDAAGQETFVSAVQKTVEYIHAGDIFQANITRRFHSHIEGNIRNASLSLLQEPGGWFGAWLEFQKSGRYVLSMSPELFLQFDGESRQVVTRPMKGTRPDCDSPEFLMDSEKDAAELHMIVDLMRNDLGRMCEFGSISVEHARKIEQHPTVWQCVGEIHGTVREDVPVHDVLRHTFPAGSVTGAPKIRAMQIINEFESTPRGPYCGAIGIFGKSLMLNVAIRTAMFEGSTSPIEFNGLMEYSTGCGIVAESIPEVELQESEVKTHILTECIAG